MLYVMVPNLSIPCLSNTEAFEVVVKSDIIPCSYGCSTGQGCSFCFTCSHSIIKMIAQITTNSDVFHNYCLPYTFPVLML